MLSFRVLGPVEAQVNGREVPLGGPRSRAVLAALLLEPNRVVPLDAIVAAAWGQSPPESARFQAQNRMSALRRAMRLAGGADVITTSGSGYLVRIAGTDLDAEVFTERLRAAQEARDRPETYEQTVLRLREALALWRGPALDGLETPRLTAAAQRLDELRLTARELLIELELRRGRHREVLAEVHNLVDEHPWRERPAAQLMLALYRGGRRRDALAAFERTQRLLTEELGLDPGQDLVQLRDQILRDDPVLATTA